MFWPAPAKFRSQAAIIAAASLAVVLLAVFIVRNVIRMKESAEVDDARQICITACLELRNQFDDWAAYYAGNLPPVDAQDLSLKGVSATALRPYKGIDGGVYLVQAARVIGYANPADPTAPQPVIKTPRMAFVRSLAGLAIESEDVVSWTNRWAGILAVGAAVPVTEGGAVVWTMRRIPVVADPLAETGRWWLAALVLCTLLGMGGIVSIWYMLNSGIASIRRGLHRLEEDFTYRFPPIRGDFGQITKAINRMAERRMLLEDELRSQDRLAALGKLVSGVAHEVRNPLNSMKLTLQLLDRRLKKGVPVSHEIQEALHEIDRLDMIVGRLLTFGRPNMINRQLQNLAPLVEQALKMVQEPVRQKEINLIVLGLRHCPSAVVDGPQIVQVLINLLLNAIDASPHCGSVRIEVDHRDANARIAVSDQGSGIAEEARPHVFDAYYTTKPNGSGLGLAVSREILVAHGGTLSFESHDSGTTFIALIPLNWSEPH
jgi:signal transduction histidine kinase